MVPTGLNQKIRLLFVFPDIEGLPHKGSSEVVEQGKWNFRRLKVVNKAKIDFPCLVISDRWRDKSTRFSRLIWRVLSIQLRERPTKRTCFSFENHIFKLRRIFDK